MAVGPYCPLQTHGSAGSDRATREFGRRRPGNPARGVATALQVDQTDVLHGAVALNGTDYAVGRCGIVGILIGLGLVSCAGGEKV